MRSRWTTGVINPAAVPVIACLWSRPERVPVLLEMLRNQTSSRPIRLILWDNDGTNESDYLQTFPAGIGGALSSIEYVKSPLNLGGIARFVVARQLWSEGYSGAFVTVDDDQDVSPRLLDDLIADHRPDRVAGWWAWVIAKDNYWDRRRANPGDNADYVGTGAAVFDTSIVVDPAFFRLPPRFGFIEDLWASRWVLAHGGHLRAVDTAVSMTPEAEESSQFHALIGRKAEFWLWLRARGM